MNEAATEDTIQLTANQITNLRMNAYYNGFNSRGRFGGRLTAYQGDRDYYKVLGYEDDPVPFETYSKWYKRGGLAKRIVDLPAQDTWKKPPQVSEEGNTKTAFVTAWDELVKRLRVWSALMRGDRLSGVGNYGVIVIGFSDIGLDAEGNRTREPKDKVAIAQINGINDVLYLRPLSEDSAKIESYNNDPSSPRYGMPETYLIDVSQDDKEKTEEYHWTRVLHLADGKTDSETTGTPRLENALNDLYDLMKLSGGGAEGSWLEMRKGIVISPKEGFKLTTSESEILESVSKYTNDPMRVMVNPFQGLGINEIAQGNVPDVSEQIDTKIDLLAADSGIPKRVLLGSAAGQLASAQEDTRQWAGLIESRQKNYAEPEILRAFIDRLIGFGALPRPAAGYDVGIQDAEGNWHWPPIVTLTELEESEVRLKNAQARSTLRDALNNLPTTREEDRELLGVQTIRDVISNILKPSTDGRTFLQRLFRRKSQLSVNQIDIPINVPTIGLEAADETLIGYSAALQALAQQAIEGEIDKDEFERQLAALVMSLSIALYLSASGKTIAELDADDNRAILEYQQANLDSIPQLGDDIYEGRFVDPETGLPRVEALGSRLSLWVMSGLALANIGNARGHPEQRFRWDLGATFEHCSDCLRLDGQVHTGAEWTASGWLPQTRRLECGGWNCDCVLRRTRERTRGNF